MPKVMVTGGAGFLGSHLCRKLLETGHSVICVDSLITGNKKNIEQLMRYPNFSFVNHDIIEPLKITEIDQIYNLACPASPPHYQKDPIHTYKTNVIGIMNLLELARKSNARILQASTSEVYGEPEMHPQPETYRGNVNPIGIRACYDEGKRGAETLMFDYHRIYQVDIRIVRIFNTYGPNMSPTDGRVVSNFIIQALRNKDITIYGNGDQTRSFCYVEDLINGIYAMMNNKAFPGPVNLGNPVEVKISELAKIILKLTNSKSEIITCPLPQDDPTQRKPAIELAKKELNWEPQINLETGLKKTIEYFRRII